MASSIALAGDPRFVRLRSADEARGWLDAQR
jgi:hypothetical protein